MQSESEASLKSLQRQLEGNVFRGNAIHNSDPTDRMNKLAEKLLNISCLDGFMEWLTDIQRLFSDVGSCLRFRNEFIETSVSNFSTSIYLEASNTPSTVGGIHVYGEYHHGDAFVLAGDEGEFLRFAARVLHIFQAEPTRHFLHAFWILGTTLELWVFDRSGAYSSETFDLTTQRPEFLMHILEGYSMMSYEELGINTFVKRPEAISDTRNYIVFDGHNKVYIQPDMIAVPDHLIGLGTTCFPASLSPTAQLNAVVKFSWRAESTTAELKLLQLAHDRNVWGVIQLLGHQDLVSIADLRQGLQFAQPFINRTLSCVATSPLGRPIRQFASIRELLEVLGDLVKALRSLYVDGRMLHRDIAIKNLIINPQPSSGSSKGVLIDFDMALDLDKTRAVEPMVGSDGFMAIGILSGKPHTYRHDLESLFYVFLWLAIANDSKHDHAYEILKGLPETSRLQRWCSMDFPAVGRAEAADMSLEGFEGILSEFSANFVPLKGLAKELHGLIFPVRDGVIFTGTDMEQAAVERLYTGMADAFTRSAYACE
ncbi:hypothetical protein V8C35DRAFT_332049 [Trichoderma chlorosporum]